MEFSTPFFNEFADAFSKPDGYQLARTLSPDVPTEKLRKIHKSQNAHNIKSVLKRGFQGNAGLIDGLDQQELQGWVEVYAAYWNAAGVIVTARESSGGSNKVSVQAIQLSHTLSLPQELLHIMVFGYQKLIRLAVVAVGVDKGLRGLDRVVESSHSGVPELRLRSMDYPLHVRCVQALASLRDPGR
jgi:hypothetical protein